MKENLTTIRLFSPLTANLYTADEYGDFSEYPEELTPAELCSHEDAILEQIQKRHLESEGDRGLAGYLHDVALEQKVYSMKPTVDVWQGEFSRGEEKLNEVVEAIRSEGGKAIGVVADTKSTEDTKRVFEETIKNFGDLDILINNAGIGEQKIIDETDDEWMMHVMDTNLGGPMRYIREALKIYLPKNDGVIINISSVNGTRPFCGATYTATKGALNTLTKNVAMRLIDTNIRYNAVAPGATKTPAHLANKKGEQPGGAKMGKAVKGQVLQVCNGAFL